MLWPAPGPGLNPLNGGVVAGVGATTSTSMISDYSTTFKSRFSFRIVFVILRPFFRFWLFLGQFLEIGYLKKTALPGLEK